MKKQSNVKYSLKFDEDKNHSAISVLLKAFTKYIFFALDQKNRDFYLHLQKE